MRSHLRERLRDPRPGLLERRELKKGHPIFQHHGKTEARTHGYHYPIWSVGDGGAQHRLQQNVRDLQDQKSRRSVVAANKQDCRAKYFMRLAAVRVISVQTCKSRNGQTRSQGAKLKRIRPERCLGPAREGASLVPPSPPANKHKQVIG